MMDSEDRLLGYLLGDIDPSERRELERLLKNSPDVARKLAAVRQKYSLLLAGVEPVAPSEDLAARVCGELFFGGSESRAVPSPAPAPKVVPSEIAADRR